MFNKKHINKEYKAKFDNDLLKQSIKDNWNEISKHLSVEQLDEIASQSDDKVEQIDCIKDKHIDRCNVKNEVKALRLNRINLDSISNDKYWEE
jgi:hypothetical protein